MRLHPIGISVRFRRWQARVFRLGEDILRCQRIRPRWIVLIGLTLLPALAASESTPVHREYSTSLYNVYSGLPANSAQVVRQTRDGYLWVGTELGLSRFDGVRFVTYRSANTPELPSNLIRHLLQDREGWLWIGTQRGLCRFRDGKFERVGLEGSPIAWLIEDRTGGLWIATEDKGLWEYRNGQLKSHADAPGMPSSPVLMLLYLDSRDRLWVGTSSQTVFYDGQVARPTGLTDAPFQAVLRIRETPGGDFWLDTDKGFFRLRAGQFRRYGVEQGLGTDAVRYLTLDRKGRPWVVTTGLYMLEDSESDRFVRVSLPGVESPRSLIEDSEGSYWVGTAGDGIARLRTSGFRMVTPENGVLGGNTRTVAIGRDGTVWAGLATTGLGRMEPNGTTTVIPTGIGPNGEVWSVLPASDGRVWIGTRTSLRLWHQGQQKEFPQLQKIRALFEDSTGTIWIGSENEGVTCFREEAFHSMAAVIKAAQPERSRTTVPVAMAFAEDSGGTMHVGLRDRGGLVKIKDGAATVLHPDEGFPTSDIRAIYPDREGNLWLGLKGRGLAVFAGGRWLNPEILSESFNDQVSSILEDEQGRLWLGTPKGIVWAPKSQLLALARGERANTAFRLALESDGIRPAVVGAGSFPTASKAADGSLWFGSRRGLAVVTPGNLAFNGVPPPVQIEQVMVDEEVAPPTAEIRLPPGAHALTINYTALSFVRPSQVLFRYRMEGHDRQWTDAGTRRTAFYTNLKPGSFRFRVLACNDDGVWNETGASIAIVQLPFFYETPWFVGLVALGLAGSGLGIFRWRTTALKQRNLDLEHRIADRTAELVKSYEAVRASEYFYQSLVESLPQIIVRKDTEGRFTYVNTGFCELLGRPLEQIVGRLESEFYPREDAEKYREADLRAMETHQTLDFESVVERAGHPPRYLHVKKVPLYDGQGCALGVQILFWDITSLREIEEQLKQTQRELVETSRLAGIAEMATGILHNLGNALNSVNVTTTMTLDRIRASKIESVGRTAQLLSENHGRLAEFLSNDPRGNKLPGYLAELARHLTRERDEILSDLQGLQASVDHIKELVSSQQQHARVAGVAETVPASELVEHSLRMGEAALRSNEIAVVRDFKETPPVTVDRQKALQIIGNLIVNARDSLGGNGRSDKCITLGLRVAAENCVQISVSDNGAGIAPENLTRIFAFGFTTKKSGHGFGLHSSALAAREMGGSLNGFSEGVGRGATFVLELPISKPG